MPPEIDRSYGRSHRLVPLVLAATAAGRSWPSGPAGRRRGVQSKRR